MPRLNWTEASITAPIQHTKSLSCQVCNTYHSSNTWGGVVTSLADRCAVSQLQHVPLGWGDHFSGAYGLPTFALHFFSIHYYYFLGTPDRHCRSRQAWQRINRRAYTRRSRPRHGRPWWRPPWRRLWGRRWIRWRRRIWWWRWRWRWIRRRTPWRWRWWIWWWVPRWLRCVQTIDPVYK